MSCEVIKINQWIREIRGNSMFRTELLNGAFFGSHKEHITLAQRLRPLLRDKKGHGWGLRSVAMGQTVAEGARVIEN